MKKLFTILLLFIAIQAQAYNKVSLNPLYVPNPTSGRALSLGNVYIGNPDTDPTVVGNQKTLYVQEEDGTITSVSQPITTGAGGVPLYNGSPVTLLVDGNYSLMVLDSGGSQVYYVPSAIINNESEKSLNEDYACDPAVAVAAIGSTPTTLILDCAAEIPDGETVTFPATTSVYAVRGGMFDGVAGGATETLIINGSLEAGPWQIFGSNLTVTGLDFAYGEWAGATAASADNTTAIQTIIDALNEGATFVLTPGSWKAQGLTLTTNNITLDFQGSLAPVDDTDSTAVITIGSASANVNYLHGSIAVINPDGYTSGATTAVGIKVLGLATGVDLEFRQVSGFYDGILFAPPASRAVAYCTFYVGYINDNHFSFHVASTSTGYANENLVIGGRYKNAADSGAYSIKIEDSGDNKPNSWVFKKPTFEGTFGDVYCGGSINSFENVRWEHGSATGTLINLPYGGNYNKFSGNFLTIGSGDSWVQDVGVATKLTTSSFTIVGDYTTQLGRGTPIALTIAAAEVPVVVASSSYSAPNTTVYTSQPLVSANSTATEIPRIINSGFGNSIEFDFDLDTDMKMEYSSHTMKVGDSTPTVIQGRADYPAMTLLPASSNAEIVFRTLNSNGTTGSSISARGGAIFNYNVFSPYIGAGENAGVDRPLEISGASSSDDSQAIRFRNSAGENLLIGNQDSTVTGASTSAGVAVLYVGHDTSTSRSINATGTVNASGADYAEWMQIADSSNKSDMQKGSVVGIDNNGKVTTKFNEAHSFVIISTDPSFIGGDTHFSDVPTVEEDKTLPDKERLEKYKTDIKSQKKIRDKVLEKLTVIAFSGITPVVGLTDWNVGDYVVPINNKNKIDILAVTNPSFEQYKVAVGKVWMVNNGIPVIHIK